MYILYINSDMYVLNVQQKMAAILVDGERQTKKITMLREETKRYWTFLVVT